MCRIAGIADRSKSIDLLKEQVGEMCEVQKHGGPDDSGMYACAAASLVLGHRRLALIDLTAAGHQPMTYNDRYVITYNGEIYNYPELKEELLRTGAVFHTQCDTEVILAAFDKWGTQSFARLSGMYAFALYDTAVQELYLVRDPSGIKPLYYSSTAGMLSFASEMRAFKGIGSNHANSNWPVYQLAYGFIPEPLTTLKEVKPLHKGCFYKYNLQTGCSSLQSFMHYSFCPDRIANGEARTLIQDSIRQAVKRHLLSDAPIGVFLSGGVDSGIVTMLAGESQQQQLKTLSLYFREKHFSEQAYQDLIIEKLDCQFYQHLLTEEEFHETFPSILQAMDMPSCDGLNTWFISKYAKAHGLKAVLSGIGGDELFGGYPSFGRISIARQLQELPSAFLKISRNRSSKKLNRLPYLSLPGVKGLYLFLRGLFTPSQIAQQLDGEEKEIWRIIEDEPVMPELQGLASKNEASWLELNIYMQNQLLRDADVMSMTHGVEIRIPFLDPQVIGTAMALGKQKKFEGPRPKQTLINAFMNELPDATWNRKKMGFSFPFTKWMQNSDFIRDTMQGGTPASRTSYEKFGAGKLHWSHLMSMMLYEMKAA